ncbi:S-layer homology domain-containing protein [Sporobacter termitidis DSM 10068]|uniref:S-layer homology domain-containing protein n=1 Tax=Sporobacter termitidis DSM 10068 TaxID=1123282 RepID=A0A1M5YSB9_9FIRM|nr:S-layer homology domain-containing protein [Sporobacter termitidis]SHI14996.1 S-layer homology domain-containing protein [Sporobacter termitidis DSM 10068]
MSIMKKGTALLLTLVLVLGLAVPGLAADKAALQAAVDKAASYMVNTVKEPQVGSIGGEWAVLGLARSGYEVPDTYYQDYDATVEAYVEACKGVLHQKKYTEYSRVIVALTSIGKDPSNVAGYNLLTPLGDYDKTIWQGLNGPIWALIALDTGNYAMPQNTSARTQATRAMYVDEILSRQLADGGWSLTGTGGSPEPADPDITGMALQALAKYQDRADVKKATGEALACMSAKQDAKGGFSSWGTPNSESVVQILVALCELGISLDDSRFVKNGHTLLDNLLTYQQADGSFQHTADGSGSNQMATEQGFYGLIAAQRARDGKPSLYRMSDAISVGESTSTGPAKGAGLEGKNAAVKTVPITKPGTTFGDIIFSSEITAIEALASREIIAGMDDGSFKPDNTMTRAEFAAIVVRALGLTPKANGIFSDVPSAEWYAPYVGTANSYGIVGGTTAATFNPLGTITRQEAAVMIARAAKLCGMDTAMDSGAVRDTLAQFEDYVQSDDWARPSLAFCYSAGILSQQDLSIRPKETAKRGEVAQMLFNLLGEANLL